jgi:hypothetical protein
MKIETIDRGACRRIREEALEALAVAMEPLGLKVEGGNGGFDATSFSFKVTFTPAGVDLGRIEFERNAPLFGLKPEHYEAELQLRGESFHLVGLHTRRPKFPLELARIPDGRKFKGPESLLRQLKGEGA